MLIALMICFFVQSDSVQTVVVESSVKLFQKAVSIAALQDGKLLIIDQETNTLNVVGKRNGIERSIGGQGWGNEALDYPTDVGSSFMLDMFVVDYNNRRVQRFDKRLHFIQSYNDQTVDFSGRFQPIACAVSQQGELFILDADNNTVIKLSARGRVERSFGTFKDAKHSILNPKDISVSPNNDVCVLDGSRVLVFDIYGNIQRTITLSTNKEWKTISISGNILVVTSSDEIRIIDLTRSLQLTISADSLIGVTVADPFSDAMISDNRILILTKTTLYRCSLDLP